MKFSHLRIKRDVNKLMKCMYMKAVRRKVKKCVAKVPTPQDCKRLKTGRLVE